MNKDQLELLDKIREGELQQTDRWLDYWQDHSSYHTWQFWFILAILVVPLIVLILFIDRRKIFQLGFYGYGIHIFFAMSDAFGVLKGLWMHPYKLFPFLPASISLDSSLVPVSYMLVYQYVINRRKNYYIWMLLLSLIFAFLIKPLLVGIGLFRFGGKENFLMLLWGYLLVGLISKWITDIFLLLSKTRKFSLYKK